MQERESSSRVYNPLSCNCLYRLYLIMLCRNGWAFVYLNNGSYSLALCYTHRARTHTHTHTPSCSDYIHSACTDLKDNMTILFSFFWGGKKKHVTNSNKTVQRHSIYSFCLYKGTEHYLVYWTRFLKREQPSGSHHVFWLKSASRDFLAVWFLPIACLTYFGWRQDIFFRMSVNV
jgi:hypothetical protein